ncbi:P-loop containing nucleoside triphosphate hydrolase protein [Aspergillus ambiguus]|uniref:kinesin family protein n=1 Tax=Aspergillus ambiguus TaxID=176160 RepID=UPI003CCCA8DC
MDSSPSSSLFQVYLRLRPPVSQSQDPQPERFLTVEGPESNGHEIATATPTHVTLQPPNDGRKRGIERFGFTQVFEESASQLNVFQETGLESLIRGVLLEGRDGLVATLGVTGSGKSHTILGSKTQKGITQMGLDVIFKSLASTIRPADNSITPMLLSSVSSSDHTESQMFTAQAFLEAVYGDSGADRGRNSRAQTPMSSSRAQTPMTVRTPSPESPLRRTTTPHPRPQASPGSRLNMFRGPIPLLPSVYYSPQSRQTQDTGPLGVLQSWSRRKCPRPAAVLLSHSPNELHFTKAHTQILKEPTPAIIFPRRPMSQRPSALPRSPDVSHMTVELNPNSEYIVLVSMYEVYNDRIFDLLSPAIVSGQGSAMSRQGNAQKDRRRPLLFKSTEGSPDRKVVAGLRKIACSTYEEALAILDIGLTERKVTGTGANSVSSRSHGFFCLEVKRRMRNKRTGDETWIGNTLTVADLAGSERARTAKTAGSTLAEAGKINESLMYLGQCLQMQSNIQDGNKTAMVPFRQCKLTELLFSNSFPSSTQSTGHNRHPQKAIMIVTADPLGDYNATSQILRYSALARDVTVPRVASGSESSVYSSSLGSLRAGSGRHSPNIALHEELDQAMSEIERLTSENESLSVKLAEEEIVRTELDLRLKASEERCLMIEQEVREECWAEMDERMEEERRKWQAALDEQAGHNDEHIDKKIELLSRGFRIHEDPEPSRDDKIEDLEFENDQLRSKLAALERELLCRSPTKKPKPKNTLEPSRNSNILGRESDIEVALRKMDQLKLADSMFSPSPASASPGKKKKMTTRKWDLAPEEDI